VLKLLHLLPSASFQELKWVVSSSEVFGVSERLHNSGRPLSSSLSSYVQLLLS
jgi:hypothetical protein